MMVWSPDAGPDVIVRASAMLPGVTTQVNIPSGPRWMACGGTRAAEGLLVREGGEVVLQTCCRPL